MQVDRNTMKTAKTAVCIALMGLLLMTDSPCSAITCTEPPEGCPPPTSATNVTLFFYDYNIRNCFGVETSGCEGYGWKSRFSCWANCRYI
uniref:Putative conserved secreted protein midgut overexpressed n=1 Tax=Rhipicephalus microplus TaxID=6941 RepID=A0A6M2CGC3_RHIMP